MGHGNLTLATEGAAEVTPALHGNPVAKKRGRAVWDRSGFRDSASANCSAAGALAPAVIALHERAIAHSFQSGGVCGLEVGSDPFPNRKGSDPRRPRMGSEPFPQERDPTSGISPPYCSRSRTR
ncbi:Hypothetical protein EPM1_1275 [Stenotrophomonas maltophilia EPM1]|nr:Hypothetical protein EPM1_1275 [Stenotrophomonas maltophilia EPM1]